MAHTATVEERVTEQHETQEIPIVSPGVIQEEFLETVEEKKNQDRDTRGEEGTHPAGWNEG